MTTGDGGTEFSTDPLWARNQYLLRGNRKCFLCKHLHVMPFRRCTSCSLPGLRKCPPLRASFLLFGGAVLTGAVAHLFGGPGSRIVFIMTGLVVAILLLVINSYTSEQARSRQRLAQLQQELAEQHEFLKDLSPLESLQACLDHVVRSAADRLRCRRVSIMMPDATNRFLHIASSRGVPRDVVQSTQIPIGERISGKVFQSSKPIHVSDFGKGGQGLPIESASFMSGPLLLSGMRWGQARLGVLSVTEPIGRDDFSLDDEFIFSNICEASAVAVYNHLAVAKVKQASVEFLETLVNAIEARDKYTRGHSERVCKYAVAIARVLQLEAEPIARLAVAARLHDIGKIGMADAILWKQGQPTEREWESIRRHTDVAVEMLAKSSLPPEVIDGIRCHHERLDGSGYPHGLKDDQIPLPGRIICVADAFDAMTTVRPYRDAVPVREALQELRRYAGQQFDASCVDALVESVERGELAKELLMPAPAGA